MRLVKSSDEVGYIKVTTSSVYTNFTFLQEISAYELKRLKNIERNRKELERLGLTTAKHVQAVPSVPDVETLPTSSIGKYCYKLTPADLQKEQQAFQAGEGVIIYITYMLYSYVIKFNCCIHIIM